MNTSHFITLSIFAALLLILFICMSVFHFKKKSVIRKVNSLSAAEKEQILDHLAEPLGYTYDAGQDIFATRHDAPQKLFGYTSFFDLSAPYFNMIYDYETIYFNYNNRTWLIEMWKGQYGINTGCELGIYYADTIVPPKDYSTAHFEAVQPRDMPEISLKLNSYTAKGYRQPVRLACHRDRHWWLTIFKMGHFTRPQNLFVNTSIRFRDCHMMHQFLESFRTTLPDVPYNVNRQTVYFTFNQSTRRYPLFKRIVRCASLYCCRMYCKWFRSITRPFADSGEKILYLYYYLPFVIRRIFSPNKKHPTGRSFLKNRSNLDRSR